ncbi:MAG: hypothetical protein V4713_03585 [Pseudomonadota bacterium]
MNTSNTQAKTGTGSLTADVLILLMMIIGGTFGLVWFLSLPTVERTEILTRGLNIFTFLLAQPGMVLIWKIITSDTMKIKKKVSWCVASFLILCLGLPFLVATYCYPIIQSLAVIQIGPT